MRTLFFVLMVSLPALANLPTCGAALKTFGEVDLTLMQAHFRSGANRSFEARRTALRALDKAIVDHEEEILRALHADLGKPRWEAVTTEVAFVREEIRFALNNLGGWMAPVRTATPLVSWPAQSRVQNEPLGVVLILSPWNYPFQLLMAPLVAAIAAGNSVVLKPSELALQTAAVISKVVAQAFPTEQVRVVEGGPEISAKLTSQKFAHIFFTGGIKVGKIIAQAAGANLVPVTLELGGKSPVIVHRKADLRQAAEFIAWGCNLNAGQTCVRPDYILVDEAVEEKFVAELKAAVLRFYGEDPSKSADFGRIINERQFDRLAALLGDGEIVIGGRTDRDQKYISPTFIRNVKSASALLNEEIFGPITPILVFNGSVEAVQEVVARNPDPLALYCFSKDRKFTQSVTCEIPFGGGAINDVVMHINNPHLPFGGVGASGMGQYHGRRGFELFSHQKAILDNQGTMIPFMGWLSRFRLPPSSEWQEYLFRLISR